MNKFLISQHLDRELETKGDQNQAES